MLTDKVQKNTMSVKQRIIMTLMKLKHNISYVVLSLLFNSVNANTSRNLIYDMISALAIALKPNVQWISAETIKKNLPLCFSNFADVQVIVDCTEMLLKSQNVCVADLNYILSTNLIIL